MELFRIVHDKFKQSVLSGTGAEKIGGRWNEVGTKAVYCSQSISLALLEYYVHSPNVNLLPKDICIAKIFIPDNFKILQLETLPEDWDKVPYTQNTAKEFTTLAKNVNFFALKVPSTIVPMEFNYVLNPLFKQFEKVKVVEFLRIQSDRRIIEKL